MFTVFGMGPRAAIEQSGSFFVYNYDYYIDNNCKVYTILYFCFRKCSICTQLKELIAEYLRVNTSDMARILGIDYGTKRCGLAVTDPLQIVVNPLNYVETHLLREFLDEYLSKEEVEKIVIGEPFHRDGTHPKFYSEIVGLKNYLRKRYPAIAIDNQDETFTSYEAKKKLVEAQLPKKKRQEKGRLDVMSAVLILQEYLGHI